ncbi:hypothetical protein TGRUB_298840 [Toxoplasma gondii RUB]|uniref:Uncharacterized protein n=8 Tax=Toxoplasma gondii TaxID=5811 RepID=S7VV73_TOXGG|nr:hypothetical protein TGGT1_298840 [Toxoplasma gondii GT1]KFG27859.1 hypothetical protein TGP89_298840 [Toxoplasma gondii p89]KFG31952.1 hypothetical protein TGFOU_298840 [Toxoplasma gondii FOU]KFG56753.1 hypothetical protein TGRUB_298840 [Toxoplasma gondii RUB]KFG99370.1 hypothetical protein TGVAND_298840 [Toxoplasma gondii VAND]KFH00918.1 hypothetical protein TGMAS_298840 [Toxoplasma gondii MAS]PUA83401.1 hypothetical protein TGBR9_298840 [Toxoplasma gondii TgCATBr9]RQX68444.1 hypothetic
MGIREVRPTRGEALAHPACVGLAENLARRFRPCSEVQAMVGRDSGAGDRVMRRCLRREEDGQPLLFLRPRLHQGTCTYARPPTRPQTAKVERRCPCTALPDSRMSLVHRRPQRLAREATFPQRAACNREHVAPLSAPAGRSRPPPTGDGKVDGDPDALIAGRQAGALSSCACCSEAAQLLFDAERLPQLPAITWERVAPGIEVCFSAIPACVSRCVFARNAVREAAALASKVPFSPEQFSPR